MYHLSEKVNNKVNFKLIEIEYRRTFFENYNFKNFIENKYCERKVKRIFLKI